MHTTDFDVVIDKKKGRCLESRRNFDVGKILWTEKALCCSSSEASDVLAGLDEITKINEDTAIILDEYVDSLDTARNLLKLIKKSTNKASQTDRNWPLFQALGATNIDRCRERIQLFQDNHPEVDLHMSQEDVAKLLGILNNNQVEVEAQGTSGSGLFVFTAITEHSCVPNASFTTEGNILYMCAIQPINIGERISIDYVNAFYRPTHERLADLKQTYSFDCDCHMCTSGVDKSRPFSCNTKDCTGVLFAPPLCSDKPWQACVKCGNVPLPGQVEMWMRLEKALEEKDNLTPEQICVMQSNSRGLYKSHYLYFNGLYNSAMDMADYAPMTAVDILQQVLSLLGEYDVGATPKVHHERVLIFDRLGQVLTKAQRYDEAQEYFKRAYDHSLLACGANTPLTMKLCGFAPQSLDELVQHY
jgi:hypothetical protein